MVGVSASLALLPALYALPLMGTPLWSKLTELLLGANCQQWHEFLQLNSVRILETRYFCSLTNCQLKWKFFEDIVRVANLNAATEQLDSNIHEIEELSLHWYGDSNSVVCKVSQACYISVNVWINTLTIYRWRKFWMRIILLCLGEGSTVMRTRWNWFEGMNRSIRKYSAWVHNSEMAPVALVKKKWWTIVK